jgi:hypothetical protein
MDGGSGTSALSMVKDCHIAVTGTGAAIGIYVTGSDSISITGCLLTMAGDVDGIRVSMQGGFNTSTTIVGNVITNSSTHDRAGIRVDTFGGSLTKYQTIASNWISSFNTGVLLVSTTKSSVIGNHFSNCTTAFFTDVACAHVSVIGNSAHDCATAVNNNGNTITFSGNDWDGNTFTDGGTGTIRFEAGGPAGGDLAGTYPNPTLKVIGSAAGPFGDGTHVPVTTIDTKGRVTALTSSPIPAAQLYLLANYVR